jgi:trimeric autotransporter adhesin
LGSNNTIIGRQAGGSAGFNPSNFGSFGYAAGYVGTNSNTIEVGNTSVGWIGGQVGFFNYSDGRIKKNIQNNVPGLAFITQLRPVTYHFDLHKQNEIVYKGVEIGDWEGKYDLENAVQTGFIAQEVEATAKRLGYDFNGVQAPKHEKDLYSVQYASFVVPLVKAVQEQQEIIENQNIKIQSLEQRLQQLEDKLSK